MTPSTYSTTHSEKRERAKTIMAVISLVAVIAGWIVTLSIDRQPKGYDTVHPMPNAHIDWLQTYHGGAPDGV